MGSSTVREEALSEVYDAAVDGDAWRRLPALLRQAVGGETGAIWILGADGRLDVIADNLPDDALTLYASHFARLDPWAGASLRAGLTGAAMVGADVVPERDLLRTEFYADFARPYRTEQVVGASLPHADGTLVGLCVHRPLRGSRFNERHRGRMQAYLPHISQVVRLRRKLSGFDAGGAGRAALESFAIGVVICERDGRVLFANSAAEELAAARDPLVLGAAGRPIAASRRSDSAGLLRLIAHAADGQAGGALCLESQAGSRVFALVAPLPDRFGAGPGRVLITLRAEDDPPAARAALLSGMFGLTPAEADVAIALLSDRSFAEIGEERAVSENTLRTQLAHVLRKTRAPSQRHLVRILGLLPPLRPRGGS